MHRWTYIKTQLSISPYNKTNTHMEVLLDDGWHNADDLGAQGYELVSVVMVTPIDAVGIFKKQVFVDEAFDC